MVDIVVTAALGKVKFTLRIYKVLFLIITFFTKLYSKVFQGKGLKFQPIRSGKTVLSCS